ncbi:MAG: DNA-formamidopyrimidine glycosylase family protein [Acidobacteriota bacterium]
MPEGDTIARAAAALHQALAGHTVTRFVTALAHLARIDDDTPLAGRTIESVTTRGKHLLMTFGGGLVLRTHMRMHGSWHLYQPGERWQRPRHAMRIVIETATRVAVGFNVPDAEFLRADDLRRNRALGRVGPDLLAPDVDPAEVVARMLAQADQPLARALLDQRVAAGLGNVFRSELLFLAGVHPATLVSSLDAAQVAGVVDTAVRLLRDNARPDAGQRVTTGRAARGEALWVYNRTTLPCRRCGTAVVSASDGLDARRVYWCPRCQPAVPVR